MYKNDGRASWGEGWYHRQLSAKMHFTQTLTAALALGGSALASPAAEKRVTVGLSKAMRQRGRSFIGTALTFHGDDQELAIVENRVDFNSITPENAQKWLVMERPYQGRCPTDLISREVTEPQRGNFSFEESDRYVDFATEHNTKSIATTFVWHSQLPPWIEAGNFDNETLIEVMHDHIKGLAAGTRVAAHAGTW